VAFIFKGEMINQSSSRVECCRITDRYSAYEKGLVLYYYYPVYDILDVTFK